MVVRHLLIFTGVNIPKFAIYKESHSHSPHAIGGCSKMREHPPVNKHNYGKLSMYRRFTHQTCLLSIATLVYQVIQFQWMNYGYEPVTKTKWDDPPSK